MNRSIFIAAGSAAFASVPGRARADAGAVAVAYAGSLVSFMEKSLGPAFSQASGLAFHGEAKGSSALASLIRDGLRTPDVFVSADTASIRTLFGSSGHDTARWYATFATTRMQIAYSNASRFASDFAAAAAGTKPWYDVLAMPGVRVARTDPAADPKGYRVVLVLELAQTLYRMPGLSQRILGDAENPEQILPEESAIARLETGDIDALWVYSTEAAARGYPVIALPSEIDLGDPARAVDYAKASVTIGAKTYTGAPIAYALTIPTNASNAEGAAAFVDFLLGAHGRALQQSAGLHVATPAFGGDRAALPPKLSGLFPPA